MRKFIVFWLFSSMVMFLYPQEQGIYEEIINRDVNRFVNEYKEITNNILILELNYENSNFISLNELLEKMAPQIINPNELLPIINKMYWSCIKCMALSTALYNNGNIKEEYFLSGMQLMKNGLIQILQGSEIMGLDINSIIGCKPIEYSE
jgi:hypothetical protein